ncbi:MAG: hypothetical protein LBG80_01600 [Bacteroidales bacterium]|jgi:hypothetical protein|nr:hypothetical protein [Bacteroidales bacterium]
MPTFIAQRISRQNNVLFPDKITVEGPKITYYKGEIIGYKSIVISAGNIASVAINENILFADVVIESKGGQTITARGFTKTDAREIMNLLT